MGEIGRGGDMTRGVVGTRLADMRGVVREQMIAGPEELNVKDSCFGLMVVNAAF